MHVPIARAGRRASASILVAIVLAVAACQAEPPRDGPPVIEPRVLPLAEAPPELPGRFVYPYRGAFWSYEPSGGDAVELATFPTGSFAGMPTASPDGRLIAFSLYQPGPDARQPGGTDLYVMAADGSDQRLVLAHDSPGASLGEPAWGPDGDYLYVTRRAPRAEDRIERADLDGSNHAVVIERAHSPSVSADGQRLAYLTTDLETYAQTLWVAQADGSGPQRLLGPPEYRFLSAPRFAPAGERLVFGAVTAEDFASPQQPSPGGPVMQLGPRTAHAHGVPYDLWLVNADGSGLERLTDLQEHAPAPAWSPDGNWIAFSGELGLYLVNPEQRRVWRLTDEGALGGLAWVAP